MGSGKHRRAAWATGLSLVLHALALTGMVVGLKTLAPPPEDRAMELRLMPAPQLRPEPAHRPPERANASPALRPRRTPQPSSEASVAALPETPAPAPAPQPEAGAGAKSLSPSLSGRLGCDGPLALRLTPEQRQVCADNLARLGREAEPLGLNIPEQKKADYDRWVHCGDVYRHAGVPLMTQYTPDGTLVTGPAAGLGYLPTFKECPAKDR